MNRNYDSIQHFLNQMNEGSLVYENGRLHRKGNLINGTKRGKGMYLAIETRLNGKKISSLMHLVIFAYHHGIEELKKHETVDHIDGDKYNNRIENLQGLSNWDNNRKANPNMMSVEQIREVKERLNKGESTVKLGKVFGVSGTTISKIKRGLRHRTI